jgi:hypothetical protein
MPKRSEERRELGRDAVIRPSTAAEWLPFSDADALRWLRSKRLIHAVPLIDEDGEIREVEVVIWGEVLDEIAGRRVAPKPTASRGRGTVDWEDPRG